MSMQIQPRRVKRTLNIILAAVLILSVLMLSLGTYFVAFAHNEQGGAPGANYPAEPGDTQPDSTIPYETPDFDSAENQAALNENVKVFSGADAARIDNALVSVDESYNAYNNGGNLSFVFQGRKEELFGDLKRGDYFMIGGDASSHFAGSYIMKVQSLYQWGNQTELTAVQPELSEVFESISIGFNDIITEENLISSTTAQGVEMHFGDVSEEITDVSYTEPLGALPAQAAGRTLAFSNSASSEIAPLGTDYSTEPTDLIISLDFDLKKSGEEDNEEDSSMDFSADWDCKITGKIGIEELSAYMVCDMPKPAQFNELLFGVRGKKVVGMGLDAELDASFNPQATKLEYEGLFIDAEISGLNKKWIPLGIWQFVGTTMIKISQSGFEVANAAPSIFIMLYMDAQGNFTIDFNTSLTYESTFNSGLSVFKEGRMNMNVVTYPYASANGEIIAPGEKNLVWSAGVSLDMDATLTLLGSSVQFYFAGIHIGEIQLIDFGAEGECHLSVSADSKDGIKTSSDSGDTSYYLRLFLKALGLKAKVSAEVEAFQHEISAGFDFAYLLVDATLFKIGKEPDDYKHRVPVSSKWVPNEFESVLCLVNDVSGSMDDNMSSGGTKIQALREAAHVITDIVENASERYEGNQGLSIVQFSGDAKTVAVPHNDYEFINACIDILEPEGSTNITAGLDAGITQLTGVQAEQKVIILMTDGQDNCSSTSEILAQAERAADNGIRVFTIGFGSDVNEEILTEVAQKTGGEYRYSATDSIVSIIGSFIYSYESSQGDVLVDAQGAVSEGQTIAVDRFDVPDEAGDLNATLYWPGSILDLILIDPNNREVDEDYPGATVNNESIPATVTIREPLPGEWRFKVKGVETSYEEEPFYAVASFKSLEKSELGSNPELSILAHAGAFCLPIGGFLLLISVMLLICINKKKSPQNTD